MNPDLYSIFDGQNCKKHLTKKSNFVVLIFACLDPDQKRLLVFMSERGPGRFYGIFYNVKREYLQLCHYKR